MDLWEDIIKYVIELKQGNLVLEDGVDFIVNASNTRLILGSGVSMAFHRHCGRILQIEMNDLLTEINETGYIIKKGDAIPSSSGRANNFKHALHVVTINSNQGVNFKNKPPDLSTIDTALINIEKVLIEYAKIHNKNKVSLVIPLLGCGIGGLSKKDVIGKYFYHFNRFADCESDVECKVFIYGYSPENMQLLTEEKW